MVGGEGEMGQGQLIATMVPGSTWWVNPITTSLPLPKMYVWYSTWNHDLETIWFGFRVV